MSEVVGPQWLSGPARLGLGVEAPTHWHFSLPVQVRARACANAASPNLAALRPSKLRPTASGKVHWQRLTSNPI